MSLSLRAEESRLLWILAIAFAVSGIFVVWATQFAADAGTKGFAIAGAAFVIPVAVYLALTRPLLFPYGLYAAFVPFDAFAQLGGGVGTVTRILGIVAGGALLAHAIRTRRWVLPPRTLWWGVALLAWMLLSVLWSVDPTNAPVEAMTFFMTILMYAIVASYATRTQDIPVLCNAIVLGAIASAFLGIYEMHHQSIAQSAYVQNYSRLNIQVGSLSVDPNFYSDAFILPFGIIAARWITARSFLKSLIPLAVMALFIVAVDIAASREAILALAIELVVIVVVLRAWKKLIPLAIAMGAGLALMPNVVMRALADQGNGGSGRTSIWKVGFAAFRQHPLFGTGSGSFAATYDQWYLQVFQPYEAGWHRASHDIILHYGVEFGIVGLVLVAAIWLTQLKAARAIPQGVGFDDMRAVLLGTIAALAFVSFVVDAFDLKFLWLAFGLIAQVRAATLPTLSRS